MIIDTHAHYDDEAFNEDRDAVLRSLKEEDVSLVVNIGASMESSERTVELVKQYPFVYGAVGVHPDSAKELTEKKLARLRELAGADKVVAIGEIGLDYYWDSSPRDVQKYWFLRQLDLAMELELPVVIHSREATQETLDIMKEAYRRSQGTLRGVIHCFSAGPEIAKEYTDMGFFIGIGGVVTFKNGKKMKEVAAAIPFDKLVLETDCPYLAPEPNRGKRNHSGYLTYVAEQIGTLRGVSAEEVIRVTEANARALYTRLP